MPKTISATELKTKIDQGGNVKIVDTLSPDSYNKCHITSAVNIPLQQIEAKAPQALSKDDQIVVYCGGPDCNISTQAFDKLQKLGFKNVSEFEGGLKEWQTLKYPIQGNGAANFNPGTQKPKGQFVNTSNPEAQRTKGNQKFKKAA